jgi:hypothetical protein
MSVQDNMHPHEPEREVIQEGLSQLAPRPRGKKKATAPNPLSVKKKNQKSGSVQPSSVKRRKRRKGVGTEEAAD